MLFRKEYLFPLSSINVDQLVNYFKIQLLELSGYKPYRLELAKASADFPI